MTQPLERIVSYAQNREDVLLSAFFLRQKSGIYVDIGANDPEADSVTKYFYDRGWYGVNIEPSPRLHAALERSRPRDINLNIGVSDKAAKLTFREYLGHGLSTFSDDTKAELAAGDNPFTMEYSDYEVKVRRLDDILSELKLGTIDFMKIDVEGYEYEVITGNDWTKYRPRILCIESNHVHRDWRKVLEQADYTRVFFDGLNEYYADAKRPEILFEYVLAVIGRPIVPAFANKAILKAEQENQMLEQQLAKVQNQLRESVAEIAQMQVYVNERTRFKNLIKDLARKIHAIILVRLRNHMRTKRSYPAISIDAVNASATPSALLATLKVADKKAFSMPPPFFNRLEIGFFTGLYYAYRALITVTKKILRRLIRLVRHG